MPESFLVQARSARRDIWLGVNGQGRPAIWGDPWLMADGTDVYQFIGDWRPQNIPFPVWLSPIRSTGRFGDMLWTGGLVLKIASTRMIEALASVDATGYTTFDVDLRKANDEAIAGYTGFATDPFPGSDIQNIYDQSGQNYVFVTNETIVDALRANQADNLDITPYHPE